MLLCVVESYTITWIYFHAFAQLQLRATICSNGNDFEVFFVAKAYCHLSTYQKAFSDSIFFILSRDHKATHVV
jgi:hypothetical protein